MAVKVLVVEDDTFLMKAYLTKLQNSGFDVQSATDGEEAIVAMASFMPDIVLLDLVMPRKDGFEVLEWLKQDGSLVHIPVVMITSSKVKADVERAHDLGARAYLLKPVALQELERLFTATEEFLCARASLFNHEPLNSLRIF